MKAYLDSVRIAPKKANLIARLVRGMPVPDAVESLRRTHKKGARIIEKLLRSAIANASHNDKQDPQMMVVKSIVVNQGQAYKRGMPKARGQTRPFRKFLSHIEITLGLPSDAIVAKTEKAASKKNAKSAGSASQAAKKPAKSPSTARKAQKSSASSESSSTAS